MEWWHWNHRSTPFRSMGTLGSIDFDKLRRNAHWIGEIIFKSSNFQVEAGGTKFVIKANLTSGIENRKWLIAHLGQKRRWTYSTWSEIWRWFLRMIVRNRWKLWTIDEDPGPQRGFVSNVNGKRPVRNDQVSVWRAVLTQEPAAFIIIEWTVGSFG